MGARCAICEIDRATGFLFVSVGLSTGRRKGQYGNLDLNTELAPMMRMAHRRVSVACRSLPRSCPPQYHAQYLDLFPTWVFALARAAS